ncbi:hypothetical protein GCM10007147_31610 [Nocardiopsis kunsanensis]|uniref:Uncharacterized protein n=1 Tax=Nocardiopsis kunsanensis TaxID=141693 RepID=A0A918XFS3_9ACTN|nr:hypothetical protein GCM10007147_31610 [Nocardiopsis kunsanensis]
MRGSEQDSHFSLVSVVTSVAVVSYSHMCEPALRHGEPEWCAVRVPARGQGARGRELLVGSRSVRREATVKVCGVAVAMLRG